MVWDVFKKSFDAWENATATMLEHGLKNPLLLEQLAAMLTVTLKVKAAQENMLAMMWESAGLATKRDQDRTLHALNQLQSRLFDLEERLSREK